METYIFLGLSVAVSVVAFFLKRIKEEVDVQKAKNAKLEIGVARHYEKIRNIEKLAEDRREDVKRRRRDKRKRICQGATCICRQSNSFGWYCGVGILGNR